MSFDVPAEAYGRFMGRYSEPLAIEFLQLLTLESGQQVLDVGCGPGQLTARLVELVGARSVSAVDPSASFVEAARLRLPGVTIKQAVAEELPFPDDTFDQVLAQLVVHFMPDPVRGLTEMARVCRPGGMVAASAWDFQGGRSPLWPFWRAVREVDPQANDESGEPGARDGQLVEIFKAAGLRDATQYELRISVPMAGFDDWWQPLTLGVGPAGQYWQRLGEHGRNRIHERCRELLPDGPFRIDAAAWTAVGTA